MNLRMCLNWKVLATLAAVGIGIAVLAPGLVSAALPLLLLAACPLSMLVMALGMKGMQHSSGKSDANAPGHEYTCAMHPQLTSTAPGRCPTCGMALVAMPSAAREERLPKLRSRLVALQADEAALSSEIAILERDRIAQTGTEAAVSQPQR